ncbi:carboxypeptidase-like regulatory domain-containing protein [Aquimarina sp. MMG015]|uniref:carboxypeptidase-like regulatory domain-containing protein n=1 Tax=Aquimarina sp. MMG015 TaxID=2822689 RepID=UPI001B39EEB7|nr:carboxypeptidase-like regulatory domain-containing protein [Aquimarina sp. MMG015]MBQ4803084.1 carboxypeptidase-like regulatory domain-containing protein [Aquimarina sp. MMG015]
MTRKISFCITFFLFLVFFQNIQGQHIITGTVLGVDGIGLENISVSLQRLENKITVAYTYTDEKGNFTIETGKIGSFDLVYSSLEYAEKKIPVDLTKNHKKHQYDVVLDKESYQLSEVVIKAERPITVKEDTVIFNAKSFRKGNESTVEDLLKNIPGFNITDDGTIKIGSQEIEKVMIEGDDFFDRGYKVLTKNMPEQSVRKVEVYQKYSDNRLLKGIENSDKIALNLKLDEDVKLKWFGNISTGYDITLNNRYELKANLISVSKKNKYYFLTNFNNIGYDAVGDIDQLLQPEKRQQVSIGDNERIQSLLFFPSFFPVLKRERTNFNNAELVSANSIFRISPKTKIKVQGSYHSDENSFRTNELQTFNLDNETFINSTNKSLRKNNKTGSVKFDLVYNFSKNIMLEYETSYNNLLERNTNSFLFNEESTNETLKTKNKLLDKKLLYTNKFGNNKVLLVTARYLEQKAPQNYQINRFLYDNLFPEFGNMDGAFQSITNNLQYSGIEAHFFNKTKKGNLLEIKIGNTYRGDELVSSFSLVQDESSLVLPDGFQNSSKYTTQNLYTKMKYRYKLKPVDIVLHGDFYYLQNEFKSLVINEKSNPFYFNPRLITKLKINKKNELSLSYGYKTSNTTVLDVYDNYILTDFRSFNKGIGEFDQLASSSYSVNYNIGNLGDNFFGNITAFYTKDDDYFSTNAIIESEYSLIEQIKINDRNRIFVSSNMNLYLKYIRSGLKFKMNYSYSDYQNIINNADIRNIEFRNYTLGFELRSGFSGRFNYHLGSKFSYSETKVTTKNSFNNNLSFLDLFVRINDQLNLEVQSERYGFNNTDNNSNYYFLDLEGKYVFKKKDMTLSLLAKNLLNTRRFITNSINDFSSSTTEYRLLPRFIMLKLDFRF